MENPSPLTQELPDTSVFPESTPAASPVSLSASRSTKTKLERSCLMCHERKIRCDKRLPCSNCVRVDILCCYPGPARSGKRPPKTTIADMAKRVARLERTITAISSGTPPDSDGKTDSGLTVSSGILPVDGMQNAEDGPAEKLLVQDGYSSRYVNEALLSRILEEEQELKSFWGSSTVDSNQPGRVSLLDIGAIFSAFNQSKTEHQGYHPSRFQATQLWQVFVNNVDPITKILHTPTIQATIFAAINNPLNIEKDLDALLFAVYFAATSSITEDHAAHLLGQSKKDALFNYKQGLEQALAGANILDTPTMRSLQAMTIYLTCLRAHNGGRSIWTLNGLLVRSAQSIGLHRDGKNFDLSPFDAEMRRRLWWAMCSADTRAAEDHGISLTYPDGSCDTQYPLNIDDREIFPDMQELPVAKSKWTEMTFALIMIETCQLLHQFHQTPVASSTGLPSETYNKQIVDGLKARFETMYLQQCDPNIPIQLATLLLSRLLIGKLAFLMQQQPLKRSDFKDVSRATEESLDAACQILEINFQLQSDDLLGSFRWLFETYTQYYMLTYVLWYLCVKPVGPGVVRAWKSISKLFEIANGREISVKARSKWEVLHRLRRKAMQIRRSENMESFAAAEDTMEDLSPPRSLPEEWGNNPDLTFGDAADWDLGTVGLPDWNNLMGDMDMRGFEG